MFTDTHYCTRQGGGMPPAKENDAVTFPSTLSPPSSSCPPTLKPLSSMYRLPLTIVPSNYNIQVSQA